MHIIYAGPAPAGSYTRTKLPITLVLNACHIATLIYDIQHTVCYQAFHLNRWFGSFPVELTRLFYRTGYFTVPTSRICFHRLLIDNLDHMGILGLRSVSRQTAFIGLSTSFTYSNWCYLLDMN